MLMKKIGCLLSAVVLLALVPVTAFAGEMDVGDPVKTDVDSPQEDTILTPSETEELGSITIELADTSQDLPKGGVSLAVVRVADVVNGEFVLTEEFANTKVNLNNIQTVDELGEAAKELQSVKIKQETILTTDDNGRASLSELPVGVYLIYAVDTAQYDQITSALVSIPTFDEAAGVMEYDLEVFPKYVPAPKKVKMVKTGVEDHVMEYVAASVLSLAVAMFILIRTVKNKIGKS